MHTLASEPHHDGSHRYVSTSAPELGERVRLRVRIPVDFGASAVSIRSLVDAEPGYDAAALIAESDGVQWWEGAVTTANPVLRYRFKLERPDGSVAWLNTRGLHRLYPRDLDDFRLICYPSPPAWAGSAVLYQVFPDRFARSAAAASRTPPDWAEPAAWTDEVDQDRTHTAAQFYGGDLDGVREHLDHLTALGVTLLYLTPVFPARSNHRYDALSFDRVDPLLGGDEALIALVEAAHARGIRVIGDLTTNHCGDGHEWFRAAYGNPEAPESEFFLWKNDEHTDYVSWLGVSSLPKFNWNSAELRRRMIEGPGSVVARWLEPPYSLDGWRIDVANMTGRYLDEDLNADVRHLVRTTMIATNPDTLLIGESTSDPGLDFPGDAWHGAMSYASFTRPIWNWLRTPYSDGGGGLSTAVGITQPWDGVDVVTSNREFAALFPWRVRLHNMNALDTHDTPRFANDALPGAVPVAVGLAMTMPGIPVIWAGDEFGLHGVDGEHSRTPLPWDAIDEAAPTIALYARLTALRGTHPALTGGGMRWLHASADAIAFVRESAAGDVVIVAARAATTVDLASELADSAVPLEGDVAWSAGVVTTDGPVFAAWSVPAPTLPEWGG